MIFSFYDKKARVLDATIEISPQNIKIINPKGITISVVPEDILHIEKNNEGLKVLFKENPNQYLISNVLIPRALEGFEEAKDLIYLYSDPIS